jgi:hypothetical protein
MENFINWISKPLNSEDITLWFNVNNIIVEKFELFFDFTIGLVDLIQNTYLGSFDEKTETTIFLSEEEKNKHFEWCWNKTIENFKKEKIEFNLIGEHKEYFYDFFSEAFYSQKNEVVRDSIYKFYDNIFNINLQYTKSDLDMLTELYKKLDKNLNIVYL